MKRSHPLYLMVFAIMMIPMFAKASQPMMTASHDDIPASNEKAWDQVYGGSDDDFFQSVIQTSDGGYLAVGYTESNADGELTDTNNGYPECVDSSCQDALIVKFDSEGNPLWDQVYGGSDKDGFNSVVETSDGEYLAVGYTNSNADGELTGDNNGNNDGLIVKFDSGGNPEWNRLYGGEKSDSFDAVIATSDGGYVAVGRAYNDSWLIKMDNFGNILWQRVYGGSGTDNLYSVIETLDGGYVAAGRAYGSEGDFIDEYHGSGDGLLVKFDENGNPLWDQLYGGSGSDTFNSVTETSTGEYIVVGDTASHDGDIDENYDGYTGGLIVKFDSEGEPIWHKVYGEAFSTTFNSVTTTGDGAHLVTGRTNHDAADDNEQITDSSNGADDTLLIKFDNEGSSIWDELYGGSSNETFDAVIETNDGGYVAAGSTNSEASGEITDSNNGNYDGLLVKFQASVPQEHEWDQVYGGNDEDYFWSVIETSDRGYLAVGYTQSNADGELTDANNSYPECLDEDSTSPPCLDALMVKFNSEGNPMWDQVYGGSGRDWFGSVVETSDGGYLVVGHTESDDGELTDNNSGGRVGLVVKFDSEGNPIWDKLYDGSGSDGFNSVIVTSDGGYLAAGYSDSDAWLVKVDSVGNIQWEQTYGGENTDYFYSVIATRDGGYVAAGFTYGGGGDFIDEYHGSGDGLLMKFDENGNLLWDQLYGGSDNDYFYSVVEASSGEYIVAGQTTSRDGEINDNYNGDYAGLFAKFDSEGNPIWHKIYGEAQYTRFNSVTAISDGHYFVSGWTNHDVADENEQITDSSNGSGDAVLIKFDNEGNSIWDELYGGSSADNFNAVIETSDGSYISAGHTYSDASGDITDSNNGNMDALLVKFPAR